MTVAIYDITSTNGRRRTVRRWPFVLPVSASLVCLLAASAFSRASAASVDPGVPSGDVVGVVRGGGGGEALAGSRIEVLTNGSSVVADSAGYYRLSGVPAGSVELRVSRDGYLPMILDVFVPAGSVVHVDVTLARSILPLIAKSPAVLSPVTVVSVPRSAISNWSDDLGRRYAGVQLLSGNFLTSEPDLLRMLGTDPSSAMRPDGPPLLRSPGVDGGRMQMAVDGIPVWNAFHGGTVVSAVTPDVVDRVVTYNGVMPAQLGGAMGSVVDVQTLAADQPTARVAIGPLASRAMWGTPWQRGAWSGSTMVAARASHTALLSRALDRQSFTDRWMDGVGRISVGNDRTTIELLAFASADEMTQRTARLSSTPAALADVTDDSATAGGTTPSTSGGSANGVAEAGVPTMPWDSRVVGLIWSQQLTASAHVETRAWFGQMQSAVRRGTDSSLYVLPCTVDNLVQQRGVSSTLQWRATTVGASFDALATDYHVTNISWPVDSGVPLDLHAAPRIGAVFLAQRWGDSQSPLSISTGVRGTGLMGGAWFLEPRLSAAWHLGTSVTATAGYARTHRFVQSLRNDVSPLRALVGMDFPVAAGDHGVPIARSDAATAAVAARVGAGVTVTGSVYHRRFTGLVLPNPDNENVFAVAGFDSAAAVVTGGGIALDGGVGVVRWSAGYGVARTATSIPHVSRLSSPTLGQSATATLAVLLTPLTHVQLTGWAATNQQTALLAQNGVYDGSSESDDNNHVTPPNSALSTWLPRYRRVDVSVSHVLPVGLHGTVSMFATVANVFNHANVATFLRSRSSASSAASSSTTWQPVILAPRSLQAGLSWTY